LCVIAARDNDVAAAANFQSLVRHLIKASIVKSTIIKRSITIARRKTSISLEKEFWNGLKDIAWAHHVTPSALALAIRRRQHGSLSSAIRVFVCRYYRAQVPASSADRADLFSQIQSLASHEGQAS
jgi:predicted DNA-binding ribbon-helix-helix protein